MHRGLAGRICCYTPPRPLEEIDGDFRGLEQLIMRMLAEGTSVQPPR